MQQTRGAKEPSLSLFNDVKAKPVPPFGPQPSGDIWRAQPRSREAPGRVPARRGRKPQQLGSRHKLPAPKRSSLFPMSLFRTLRVPPPHMSPPKKLLSTQGVRQEKIQYDFVPRFQGTTCSRKGFIERRFLSHPWNRLHGPALPPERRGRLRSGQSTTGQSSKATPTLLSRRHFTRHQRKSSCSSLSSKRSGMPTALETFSIAPPGERFRTMQSIVEDRLLKAILAPLRVRCREIWRCSGMFTRAQAAAAACQGTTMISGPAYCPPGNSATSYARHFAH
jgi:hypothetical protein